MSDFTSESWDALYELLEEENEITLRAEKKNIDKGRKKDGLSRLHKQTKASAEERGREEGDHADTDRAWLQV